RPSSSSARTSTAGCSRSAPTTSVCWLRCSVAAPRTSRPGSTSSACAPQAKGLTPARTRRRYAADDVPVPSPTQLKVLVPGNHLMVDLLGQRDELLKLVEASF